MAVPVSEPAASKIRSRILRPAPIPVRVKSEPVRCTIEVRCWMKRTSLRLGHGDRRRPQTLHSNDQAVRREIPNAQSRQSQGELARIARRGRRLKGYDRPLTDRSAADPVACLRMTFATIAVAYASTSTMRTHSAVSARRCFADPIGERIRELRAAANCDPKEQRNRLDLHLIKNADNSGFLRAQRMSSGSVHEFAGYVR